VGRAYVLDRLREIRLFGEVPEPLLEEFAGEASELRYAAGEQLWGEGDAQPDFHVLVEGGIEWWRTIGGERVVLSVHRPPTFSGAITCLTQRVVQVGGRAIDDTRVISFPGAAFRRLCRQDEDLLARVVGLVADVVSGNEAMLRQRDRLASVGTLAAGLSHEINNPAAAALRQVAALRATLGGLLDGNAGAAAALPGRVQDPLEAADREETLGAWLEDRGVADAWGTAAALAEAGADVAWAEQVGAERLPAVATAVAAGGLLDELDDALRRIVALTATMRDYAHLDQAPEADVDVTEGVETSLGLLAGLLEATSTVVNRAWSRTTPIVAYPGELNEVWTALLRNAVEAAPGGVVEVRGAPLDGGGVQVTITDEGPGVPADLRDRIWDPFFSTKDGASGLGLDLARRTIVGRHRGRITLEPRDDGRPGSVVRVDLPEAR
jgi:signal transduction histidine kinase